jgi:hypothetical protein
LRNYSISALIRQLDEIHRQIWSLGNNNFDSKGSQSPGIKTRPPGKLVDSRQVTCN